MNYPEIEPVSLEEMIYEADPSEFKFKTTAEIELPKNPIDRVKGQSHAKLIIQRAINAHENILLRGPPGCGKSLLAGAVAEKVSKQQVEKQLYDQVAVHNFLDEDSPKVLSFPTPGGSEFVEDLEYFVKNFADAAEKDWSIKNEILNTRVAISRELSEEEKNSKKDGEEGSRRDVLTLGELMKRATKIGGYEAIEGYEDEMDLHREELLSRKILSKNQGEFSKLIGKVFSQSEYIPTTHSLEERFVGNKLELITEKNETDTYVSKLSEDITNILEKYEENSKAGKFIREVRRRVLKNPEIFKDSTFKQSMPELNQIRKSKTETEQEKFKAKLLVDNSETKGLPVEYIENPSMQSFLGEAGHDAYNSTPQHLRLKPGKLHKANGGLAVADEIVNALQQPEVRNCLLTVFQEKKGSISGGHGNSSGGTSAAIQSEPVDADCVLIGCANEDLDKILAKYPKISRRFPQKVNMDSIMENTKENRRNYVEFIKYAVDKHNNNPETLVEIPHYNPEGVAAIIERGVRLSQKHSGGKDKLTNILSSIEGIVKNSALIAQEQGANVVGREHVERSMWELKEIHSPAEKKHLDRFKRGIKLQTEGYVEGSVNGLVVISDSFGNYSFGLPQKIEASVDRAGKEGFSVTSIDQNSELGGKIFTKANWIVEGFMKQRFIKKDINKVSMRSNFSQTYDRIDGDSASIATTLALLSRLSGTPVNQSYAVTGSMNLEGEVQMIGGVNEKIEGFYQVCKQKGFKKSVEYGVLIPETNVQDLILPKEIAEHKQFKIYPISHLEEAVGIMMNNSMEEIGERVDKKLKEYFSKK